MKSYIVILILLLCVGCDGAISAQKPHSQTISIEIGKSQLVIPSKYIANGVSSFTSQTSLDTSTGILLKIPMKDLGFTHGDQNNLVKNITLLVSPITEHYQNNQLGPDAIDAWTGKGLYRKSVIEFDETVGLYRIAPKAGYPKLWHYFKEKPSQINKSDAEWIGNCTVGPLDNESKDMSNVACSSTFINLPLQIEVTFAGTHIKSIDAIHKAITSKVETWTKN